MKRKYILTFLLCFAILSIVVLSSNKLEKTSSVERVNYKGSIPVHSLVDYANSEEILAGLNANTFRVGVHNYYGIMNGDELQYDFIITPSTNPRNNESDFSSNSQLTSVYKDSDGVIHNNDYIPWVNYYKTAKASQFLMDDVVLKPSGEYTNYEYFAIRNLPQSFNSTTGYLIQNRTLRPGEKIFFEFDVNPNQQQIQSDLYTELRLNIDYGWMSGDIDVSLTDSIAFYVVTSDGTEYGPYRLDNTKYIRTYIERSSSSDTKVDSYKLTSENLLTNIPTGKIIQKIKVVPYEFYPLQQGSFKMFAISLLGYHEHVDTREYVDVTNAESITRNKIASNMIDIATFKWGVSTNPNVKLTFLDYYSETPSKYSEVANQTYYGIPYTVNQQATILSFIHHSEKINNYYQYKVTDKYLANATTSKGNTVTAGSDIGENLYVYEKNSSKDTSNENRANTLAEHDYVPNTAGYLIGVDCGSSVNYALSKELALLDDLSNSGDYFTSFMFDIVGDIDYTNRELEDEIRRS